MRIIYNAETASGNRKGWGKLITSVRATSELGAKRFEGEYLKDGHEVDLPVGAIILETFPVGSAKHGSTSARFLRVDPEVDGGLAIVNGNWDWRKQFLSVVDRAKSLLDASDSTESKSIDLSSVSTEELKAELAKRGL